MSSSSFSKSDHYLQRLPSDLDTIRGLSKIDGFENSRDIIWPNKARTLGNAHKRDYEAKHNWNDFSRLWDFLAPWQGRLLSTNPNADDSLFSINKIFKTKIKLREAGSVELASLLRRVDGKFVVSQNANGKYELFTAYQRYDESFQEALYRGIFEEFGVEIENGSKLWALSYQAENEDKLGNDIRSFLMESTIIDGKELNKKKVLTLSKEEVLASLKEEKWDSRHVSMLKVILQKRG